MSCRWGKLDFHKYPPGAPPGRLIHIVEGRNIRSKQFSRTAATQTGPVRHDPLFVSANDDELFGRPGILFQESRHLASHFRLAVGATFAC